MCLPMRQMLIYQPDETIIMTPDKEVHHLMYDDVFEAFRRFLREFGIEPDALCVGSGTAPLRFHSLDEKPAYLDA